MSTMRQLALLVAIALVPRMSVEASPPKLEVGAPFPDIVLPAMRDGSRRSIADFRGEKIVLHVFASW
jgi:hypothetical protein